VSNISESELDYDKDDFSFANNSDTNTNFSRLASAISPLPISCESSPHLHSSFKPLLLPQQSFDMKPPLRIAILECDTPLEGTRTKYELSVFDVVSKQEYPDLDKIDAVLLTGSSMHHIP
jgi:hypothetical protein